jgi:hypothetical protein
VCSSRGYWFVPQRQQQSLNERLVSPDVDAAVGA